MLTFTAAFPARLPVAALMRSAVLPWTVTNSLAGAEVFAPCGNGRGAGELPSASEMPTRDGSFIVFSVIRKRVSDRRGFTRSSTRSAALFAYTGFVG